MLANISKNKIKNRAMPIELYLYRKDAAVMRNKRAAHPRVIGYDLDVIHNKKSINK